MLYELFVKNATKIWLPASLLTMCANMHACALLLNQARLVSYNHFHSAKVCVCVCVCVCVRPRGHK